MKLDLIMRKFAAFDCGRGTMFPFCMHVASIGVNRYRPNGHWRET